MRVRLPFNEAKAAQAAALLLKLSGGRMNYMKLIKLMYLVDREALIRWGRPVSTDRYVSMARGPMLSQTHDLITEGPTPGVPSPWYELISEPERYEVSLRTSDPPTSELSRAEEGLMEEIFLRHGKMGQWDLVDLLHKLPEWQDPEGSAIPIDYSDILRAGDKTALEIAAIEAELEDLAVVKNAARTRS